MRTKHATLLVYLFFALCVVSPAADSLGNPAETRPCGEETLYFQLNRAVSAADMERARSLLKNGADPNGFDYQEYLDRGCGMEFSSPLMVATYTETIELVRLLLASGANPNVAEGEGQTPFSMAKKLGYKEIEEMMLSYGGK